MMNYWKCPQCKVILEKPGYWQDPSFQKATVTGVVRCGKCGCAFEASAILKGELDADPVEVYQTLLSCLIGGMVIGGVVIWLVLASWELSSKIVLSVGVAFLITVFACIADPRIRAAGRGYVTGKSPYPSGAHPILVGLPGVLVMLVMLVWAVLVWWRPFRYLPVLWKIALTVGGCIAFCFALTFIMLIIKTIVSTLRFFLKRRPKLPDK